MSLIVSEAEAREEIRDRLKSARRHKSSRPGHLVGGSIQDITWEVHNGRKYLRVPEGYKPSKNWLDYHGHKFAPVSEKKDGLYMPVIRGGSRQYFMDTLAEPPLANLTAVTATSETGLWVVAQYSPIAAYDCRVGKIYKLTAGGIWTNATTGSLTITPRFGQSATIATNISMGPNINAATVGTTATTSNGWILELICVCRTVGATGGANGTVIGSGFWATSGAAVNGAASGTPVIGFGGLSAAVDTTLAQGLAIGWTLTVAGTITPQYAFIQSLN